MRKRNFLNIFDIVLWQLLGLLPILLALFMSKHLEVDFNTFISQFFSSVDMSSNAFYIVLNGIFGSGYNLNILNSFIYCISFYATVQCVHLVIDVLLFIPQFCINIMSKCSR